MKRTWLGIVIVLALVIVGVVIHLARPRSEEADDVARRGAPLSSKPSADPGGSVPPVLSTCIGPKDSQISQANLVAKHNWAHSLLLKGHVETALTELRSVANLDPGYPAINYEIADALVKSKRVSEAKDAIKLQLEISECIANLAPTEMQAYCKAEADSLPQGGCAQELAKIVQEANYEAGLIDAKPSRSVDSISPSATATAATQKPRVAASPTASAATGAVAGIQPSALAAPPAEAPVAKAPVIPRIASIEASEHVGQRVTVCGSVLSKHTAESSNGKPTFVNLDRSFPEQTFTVVIWGNDGAAVGDFPEAGKVCVTGTVAMYRGNPQIVLHDAQSWSRLHE